MVGPTPPPPPPPKPYDAEIEYIESNGQQFINTGILVGEYPFKVELRALVISGTRSENDFFGSYYGPPDGNERKCIVCGHYNGTIHVWTGSRWQPQSIDFGQWYDISLSLPSNQAADMVINENEYHTKIISNITESPSTICLFCDGENHASYLIGRIASFKMIINNSLVLDMIPVRIGTVGMMYDRKSGTFFGNDGRGEFRCGPDID